MIEVREVKKREEKGKCPKDECCAATNVFDDCLRRMSMKNASRNERIDRVERSFNFG